MKNTIVVVEDDLIIAKVIQKILQDEGFLVVINVNTVEFAKIVIEEKLPILVLIDINLQEERDGISLGHYLFQKGTIPYIYISSFSDKFTLERVKVTYPHGFIAKPFKNIDLLTTVSIVLNNFKPSCVNNEFYDKYKYDEMPLVLKKIVGYIDDNINEKFSIRELAAKSRWKHQHFIRVFTNHMGVTPYQFILLKKIEKAQKLIIETNITTFDIAFELGFLSYTNFSNAFKKVTGKTPSRFRSNYGTSLLN